MNVGDRIGGYTIREVTHVDAGRVTCVAKPPWQRQMRVALEVSELQPFDREFVSLKAGEATLYCGLRHANIECLYDVGRDGDHVYVATQLLVGAFAHELAPFPFRAALAIGAAVCAGLDHLHSWIDRQGASLAALQRELSVHTVHVGCDGGVIMRHAGDRLPRSRPAAAPDPLAVRRLAPEQCRDRPLDARTDVFLAGALVWEMLAGRARFGDELDAFAVMSQTVNEPAPRISTLREVPPALDAALARALALDPAARPPSAATLGAELDALGAATPRELARLVCDAFPERARRFRSLP